MWVGKGNLEIELPTCQEIPDLSRTTAVADFLEALNTRGNQTIVMESNTLKQERWKER